MLSPNRIVAFAGPYISVVSGVIATWLITKVHVLGVFHTTQTQVASAISQVAVFSLTSAIVWAGHHKWLTGWIQNEANQLLVTNANVVAPPPPTPPSSPTAPPTTPAR